MATITIPDEQKQLSDTEEIRAFLAPYGIWFDRWNVEGRIGPDATNEEILAAYQPEIDQLKAKGGYVTADVINVNPQTPGLDQMLNKFNKEHTHSEDEVRFTVKGGGVFHIHPENGPVFAIQVESGDLINVPAGTKHWFDLCNDRTIRCIRLFLDMSGWSPAYTESGIDRGYAPVCWGAQYLAPQERVENQAIKI
jgi:1,2-dihydroxy-3-keto-5-methylthiopentene dioxygenase